MTGKEIITRSRLVELGACADGLALFDKNHPDGQGEYQKLLDEACAADQPEFATWLFRKVGLTEDTLELEEVNDKELSIVFAGSIRIKKIAIVKFLFAGSGIKAGEGIEAGEGIKAGWGIEAGEGIKAGSGIKAGRDIEAGWGIEAGEEYGIFAGLRVKITNRDYRTVKAKSRPENLMCGEFVEAKNETDDEG